MLKPKTTPRCSLLVLFCLALLAGCGRVPDLKVTVSLIPNSATRLWALLWQGTMDPVVANEQLLFQTTPPTPTTTSMDPMAQDMNAYSYSFGLNVDSSYALRISVAAFAQTSAGLCYRRGGISIQTPGFRLLTTLPLLLDEMPIDIDGPTTCYDQLEGQTKALISSLSAQIERPAGSTAVSGNLIVHGWNFDPRAAVTIKATIIDSLVPRLTHDEDLMLTEPGAVEISQPSQIRVRLNQDQVKLIQRTSFVLVTLTNPGVAPLVYGSPVFE